MRWLVGLALGTAACGGAETQSQSQPQSPLPSRPLTTADLRPSSDGSPPALAPNRLEPFRIAGETSIRPSDEVRVAAQRTGQELRGSFKYCVHETGRVSGITMLQTTQANSYDAKILAAMQRWAYRPVMVDGHATAVCSAITFIFNAR